MGFRLDVMGRIEWDIVASETSGEDKKHRWYILRLSIFYKHGYLEKTRNGIENKIF